MPEDVPVYSIKHIKRRLIKHFGKTINVTELVDKVNLVTLKHRAASILRMSHKSGVEINSDE